MPIIPNQQAMHSVSRVMARSLQDLHKIIEEECNHEHRGAPKSGGCYNYFSVGILD